MLKAFVLKRVLVTLLCYMSVAHSRLSLEHITEVDRERDHLRRQLKDPEEFIKPLSQQVSFYIAGEKKLNYDKKLTLDERDAALKSILRTAIIHGRFKEAFFTEYFGEIKSGQRDLYYRHVAHVNVAYCAAECLVQNQVPLDLPTLVKQVLSKKSTLDIFKRQSSLQERFTEDYITGFLGEQFIRWYVELNVGFPDITNQFVFDERITNVLKKLSNGVNSDIAVCWIMNGNISQDTSFPCYVYHSKLNSCVPQRDRNLILCYEIAEIMGLHGLVAPAYSFQTIDYEVILKPHQLPGIFSRIEIDKERGGRKGNSDLYDRLATSDYLSKVLSFWFLTQQEKLSSTDWIKLSSDMIALNEVREIMRSVDSGRLEAPYPFCSSNPSGGYSCYYEKFSFAFDPVLMRRVKRLQPKDFSRVFKIHNTTETEEAEFYERLAFFQETLETYAQKPIHELFVHLWQNSIFADYYKLIERVETIPSGPPQPNFLEVWNRHLKTWEREEEEEKKRRESGHLQPSALGFGYVKYPDSLSSSTKTTPSIDEEERERRRKLAAEAAVNRMREEEKKKDEVV